MVLTDYVSGIAETGCFFMFCVISWNIPTELKYIDKQKILPILIKIKKCVYTYMFMNIHNPFVEWDYVYPLKSCVDLSYSSSNP